MHAQHDRRELNHGQDEQNDSDDCRQPLVPDWVESLHLLFDRHPVRAGGCAQLRTPASGNDDLRTRPETPADDMVNLAAVSAFRLANSREQM